MSGRTLMDLARNDRGLALIEFAYVLPFMVTLGMGGLETANYVITVKSISDTAALVADNASRMATPGGVTNKKVTEAEINDVLIGANLNNEKLDLASRGRVIVSSLELNGAGGQYIHWQRCYGGLSYNSTHGVAGDGATGAALPGMGAAGHEARASANGPVMFVEIAYDYQPLFRFAPITYRKIVDVAAFTVRASRDLSSVSNPEGVAPSSCS